MPGDEQQKVRDPTVRRWGTEDFPTGNNTDDAKSEWCHLGFLASRKLWFAKTLADFEINDLAALPPLFCYNS